MGIQSDVAIALKHEAYNKLSPEVQAALVAWADDQYDDEDGVLFHATWIKWYVADVEWISNLYDELGKLDDESYRIVEACHDFPDSSDNDRGEWDDNPWDLYISRDISVSVYIRDTFGD